MAFYSVMRFMSFTMLCWHYLNWRDTLNHLWYYLHGLQGKCPCCGKEAGKEIPYKLWLYSGHSQEQYYVCSVLWESHGLILQFPQEEDNLVDTHTILLRHIWTVKIFTFTILTQVFRYSSRTHISPNTKSCCPLS